MPGRTRSTGRQKILIPLVVLLLWFGGRAWYFTPSAEKGEIAQAFTATTADGERISLPDLRGRWVLLDFWGSWCGPCRKDVPKLKKLAHQYSDELAIISIAIERDSSSWLRGLERDGRFWPYQIMDRTGNLKFLSGEIADLYGINSVPTKILVTPAGSVLLVDVDVADVESALQKQN